MAFSEKLLNYSIKYPVVLAVHCLEESYLIVFAYDEMELGWWREEKGNLEKALFHWTKKILLNDTCEIALPAQPQLHYIIATNCTWTCFGFTKVPKLLVQLYFQVILSAFNISTDLTSGNSAISSVNNGGFIFFFTRRQKRRFATFNFQACFKRVTKYMNCSAN